jgi:ABC-type glycerol-3-phosphate transport system substrate-binding protein
VLSLVLEFPAAMIRLLPWTLLAALLALAACGATGSTSADVVARPEIRYYVIADT